MKKRVGAGGYSIDLRERIVAAALNEHNHPWVAQTFGVDVRTIAFYLRKHEAGTLSQVKRPTERRSSVQSEHEQILLQQLEENLDATLEENARLLEAKTGLKLSDRTVDRVFRRQGITSKKTRVAAERNEELRQQFLNDRHARPSDSGPSGLSG